MTYKKGDITVKLIDGLLDEDWDNFVDESNNGTIFHKLRFLSYHHEDRFDWHNLLFLKEGKIIALLPGAILDKVYYSPMGASYGGFVYKKAKFEELEKIVDAFLEYCRVNGIRAVQLGLAPGLYAKRANEILEYLLYYKGFVCKRSLLSNVSDLSLFPDTDDYESLLQKISQPSRGQMRQSLEANITVEINEDYEDFYPIILKNKKKFEAKATHSLEDLQRLQSLFPENLKLFMAYIGDERIPAAGVSLFICNKQAALAFYICQDYEFQRYRVVKRLLLELIKWCKANKIAWLDLGISVDTGAENIMEPSRSLIQFKENVIRSTGFMRNSYYKKIS